MVVINITGKSIAWLLAAAGLIWLAMNFSSILLMLFIAILLAVAITPLVERLEQQRLPRPLAIGLIYVGLLLILSVALAAMIPVLVEEVNQLSTNMPQLMQSLLDLPDKWIAPYVPGFGQAVHLSDLATQLSAQIGAVVGSIGGLLVGFGRTLSTILFSTLLVLVVAFLLTSDAAFAPRFIARFFPPQHRSTAANLARDMGSQLGHWVRAQLLVCLFYGTCFGIGLGLMGVPYAFALGLAAAFMELIPYIGGLIVTILAIVVALSVSPWLALGVVVLYLIVSTIEANILYPKVVGDIVGLHPLVVIVALFVGAEVGGVIGALLAVPFTVILQVLFDYFYRFDQPEPLAASLPAINLVPPAARAEPAAPESSLKTR
jgi:predicted PurR-regulated permease PerM